MTEITRSVEQLVADVDVDDDGYVCVTVTAPLTVDEARDVARAILEAAQQGAAYLAEEGTRSASAVPSWAEKVHGMPLTGYSTTTCCGISPFELPAVDRITAHPDAITCSGKGGAS
ncbi:MAG TPA: hypothetical protein VIP82_20885 [Microbacterium sp.]|uniref:hypothetical protein n=1 Tax=Microbacterium sp. TaxID=51671 RepID=UPI002F955F94